jgi:hypothetical protein
MPTAKTTMLPENSASETTGLHNQPRLDDALSVGTGHRLARLHYLQRNVYMAGITRSSCQMAIIFQQGQGHGTRFDYHGGLVAYQWCHS